MNFYDQKINYLIPVFNREKFIEETIESIVADIYNFSDKKVIILDDGSTDSSLDVINKYKDQNNLYFIEIYQQDNLGIVAARNKLISLSSNDAWLFLIDSDDRNIKGRTINILEHMMNNGINVCGAFLQCFGFRNDILSYPTDDYTLKKMSRHLSVFGNPSVTFSPGLNSLISYKKTPEDFYLFRDLSYTTLKFGNVAMPLVEYRTHDAQITKEHWYKAPDIKFFNKIFNLILIFFNFKISTIDKIWFLRNYLALGKIKYYFK